MEYVNEINSIEKTLKFYNENIRILRKKRDLAKNRLYEYMKNRNLTEIGGIQIEKIAPKNRN